VSNRKLNDVLKPYEISGEQYNVLRMKEEDKGNPACEHTRTNVSQNQ
jgi:hypothetical protein